MEDRDEKNKKIGVLISSFYIKEYEETDYRYNN